MSNQQNLELEERTFEVLVKAAMGEALNEDDVALLCYHCGISRRDVLNVAEVDFEPHKRTFFMEDMIDKAEYLDER